MWKRVYSIFISHSQKRRINSTTFIHILDSLWSEVDRLHFVYQRSWFPFHNFLNCFLEIQSENKEVNIPIYIIRLSKMNSVCMSTFNNSLRGLVDDDKIKHIVFS